MRCLVGENVVEILMLDMHQSYQFHRAKAAMELFKHQPSKPPYNYVATGV